MRKGFHDMHRLQDLVRLHRQGYGPVDVARLLQIDRKTERKYRSRIREAGLLDGSRDAELPSLEALREAVVRPAVRPPQERSSIEAHTAEVAAGLRKGLGPTAIHALLMEEVTGYQGSLSAVKRLYKRLKKAHGPSARDVAIPVHTVAGQQAQVDFGYVGLLRDPETGKLRKAWVFVMVLSYSRYLFARVVFDQRINTWLDLHRQAFTAFNGVPKVIVPDNLKAAVIRSVFDAEGMGVLNRDYRELARHYDFTIDPTPAYSPEKKGKVESAVKYLKQAFFKPRVGRFEHLDDANRRLDTWVRDTANQRLHGTTQRRPCEVLVEEHDALQKLPEKPFILVLWHKATVGRNSHVVLGKRYYSVPWVHLGKEAWLKVVGEQVTIYIDDERVADHRTHGPTPWSTVANHLPEGRRDFAERDPNTWYRRADAIHEEVGVYVRAIMESDQVHYPLRRVQSIVRTLEGLSPERAVSVAKHAARYSCYRPDAVRRIAREGLDLVESDHASVSVEWASNPRYARQVEEFLRGERYGCA